MSSNVPPKGDALSDTGAKKGFPHKVFVLVAAAPLAKKKGEASDTVTARSTEKMLQVLHEAIYLFDGRILDPFSTVVIGVFPKRQDAVKAALKAQEDLKAEDQERGGKSLQARLVVITGWIVGEVAAKSPFIEAALEVLKATPAFRIAVPEELVTEGRYPIASPEPLTVVAEVKFFDLLSDAKKVVDRQPPPSEVPAQTPAAAPSVASPARSPTPAQKAAPPSPAAAAEKGPAETRPSSRKRGMGPMIAVAAGGVLFFALLAGVFLFRRKEAPPPPVVAAVPQPVVSKIAERKRIMISPFTVSPVEAVAGLSPTTAPPPTQTVDAAAVARGENLHRALIELLRSSSSIVPVDAPQGDPSSFSALLEGSPAGIRLVPTGPGSARGEAVGMEDEGVALEALSQFVLTKSGSGTIFRATTPTVYRGFSEAANAQADKDQTRAAALIRQALKDDPGFLPAQVLAMKIFSLAGNRAEALQAAKAAASLDPKNPDTLTSLAVWSREEGDLATSVDAYRGILTLSPGDTEALTAIGRYALAAGDAGTFSKVLSRLRADNESILHKPDTMLFEGKFAQVEQPYYDEQAKAPNNAALSLKIGRLEVLRHSLSLAEIELKNLERLDPGYAHPLLRAYMSAEQRNAVDAVASLAVAQAKAKPEDDVFTFSAEVYAILNRPAEVIAMLEKAYGRGEATAAYILANPVFRYLDADPAFQQLKAKLRQQRDDLKQKLASVVL